MANNAAIDWSAKLLKVKASSAEAEMSAGCLATKRILFVRNVMTEPVSYTHLTLPTRLPV